MKINKEIREWGITLTVIGILYFTGWYKNVGSFIQSGILELGFIKPELVALEEQKNGSYNFSLLDASGNSIDFDTFRNKTVFINFWATWCPPCIAEMPDINDLYDKVASDDIVFVMISVDDDFEKAKNFIEKKAFNFPIYQRIGRLPSVYASRSIPTTFVLSPSGKIIAQRSGMAKYDTPDFIELLKTAK